MSLRCSLTMMDGWFRLRRWKRSERMNTNRSFPLCSPKWRSWHFIFILRHVPWILWWEGKFAGFENVMSPRFPQIFLFLLLLSFPITFFLPSASPWLPLWYELCMTTLDDDSKGKYPFQYHVHLSLTLLTLIPSIITPLFLSRSKGMATNVDSLEPGLDGQVNRLGIGRKDYEKHGVVLILFFRCAPFPL
jgi:hypothetical protein